MNDRPPPLLLDDLARPRFNDEARAILDMMSEAGAMTSLEPDALMEAAVTEAGLDDFGPDDFVARLEVLCASLRDEARLNAAGMLAQSVFLIGLLRNRLLLEDLIRRHPEILDVSIARPIVICGLPGPERPICTTSSPPTRRSVRCPTGRAWSRSWLIGNGRHPAHPTPRWERTEMALSFVHSAMPEFDRMHEMTLDHVHEEIQLLAIDFSTMLFETIAPIPTWRDHYLARDQRPSYAYLKKILQALQWLRGGSRWILKSPQHLEQFPALLEVFPDATFVITHRDPVSVTASMVTMLAYSARLGHDEVDVPWIGHYWSDRLAAMLRACVDSRDVLPVGQTIDVHFDEFMRDDVAMVRRIYDLAAEPFDERVEAAMTEFMRDHPRGRHGGVMYDLAQFELARDSLRDEFAFYVERFGITQEG